MSDLKKIIEIAAGRMPADLVIKGCKIVNVYSGQIEEGDIAICDGLIAGTGDYDGRNIVDGKGKYALPGFIDSHIHIESAFVTPEEISRLLSPHGTTTIIADPHEIVNVCGVTGLQYMLDAAEEAALDIKFMLPSCVPSTPFEHAGAVIDARAMEGLIDSDRILGLGEFMNYPGIIGGAQNDLDKIEVAHRANKIIDGHSPAVSGKDLNAYVAAGVTTDHECSTVEEMKERISRGMYVLMRQGSACHDLEKLIKGLTPENSRRCLLCSDDRQPETIFREGHIEGHLRLCVGRGVDTLTAVRMATLNAAECYRLHDRGAIAPGLRADIVLVDDLTNYRVSKVWNEGVLVADNGEYLLEVKRHSTETVLGTFHVKDFSRKKLEMNLKSDEVYVIDVLPGGVVTGKGTATVQRDDQGDFLYNPEEDVVKMAVVERHQNTGNVACALLRGYGIKKGAIAVSVAHDSHNIITAGISNEDIAFAVRELIRQNGGVVLVNEGKIIDSMPLPVGGIMSDQSGEWVRQRFTSLHKTAYEELGVKKGVEPVMTLAFMALPVIPELKLTDEGLFDVTTFQFIDPEVSLRRR